MTRSEGILAMMIWLTAPEVLMPHLDVFPGWVLGMMLAVWLIVALRLAFTVAKLPWWPNHKLAIRRLVSLYQAGGELNHYHRCVVTLQTADYTGRGLAIRHAPGNHPLDWWQCRCG